MDNKTAYLIGIKGVGMTALAVYLKQAGYRVRGSDHATRFVTDEILEKENIPIFPFDSGDLIKSKPDLVIVSGAYGLDNPDVAEAYRIKLKVMYHSEAVGMISAQKKVLAVAGVHGKTTTTAMVSTILKKAGFDPSFLIGAAEVPNMGPGHKGDGDYFVVEADEYRKSPSNSNPRFLDLNPEYAIISSIELDHPDVYPTIEDIYQAFYRLACRVSRRGSIILCIDYPKCRKLQTSLADRNFETYGVSEEAEWQIVNFKEGEQTEFSLKHGGEITGPYALNLPGIHNALNATAAIILASKLNISDELIKDALSNFRGVQRRFEKIGNAGNIEIYDDYAHHPTAISKTLEAARQKFPKAQIWAVFQPHTYSRTESLLKDFGNAFNLADHVVIAEIYASEREKEGNVSAENLVEEIKKHFKGDQVQYFKTPEAIIDYLKNSVRGPAVIITMGAGDIYKTAKDLPSVFMRDDV